MNASIIIPIIFFALIFAFLYEKKEWLTPKVDFPLKWRLILKNNISYYNSLSNEKQRLFEYKVQEFLLNCKITGVSTEVDLLDKLMIASSAVIPVLSFPKWRYHNIKEVILYPDSFNLNYETGVDKPILGLVGYGFMEGKMLLSRKALRLGFENESDKKNTAIHEFIHLIDKMDGTIDGVPKLLMEKQYAIPWLDLINEKISDIKSSDSDINPYGATNRAEFFSVASEYFFERPKLLSRKHPKLYQHLERIFQQDIDEESFIKVKVDISRNDPCPCESGLKYKKCCGVV